MKDDADNVDKTGLQRAVEAGIPAYSLDGDLPDLDEAQELKVDFMDDYWSPSTIGESKKVFFQKIDIRPVLEQQTGETIELECAFFIEKDVVTQAYRTISNGSCRLVGALQSNGVKEGMPLLLTYLGKKKTGKGNYCDNWSIKPLIVSANA